MPLDDSLKLAVALYGFLPRTKRIEKAGRSYEYSIMRDNVTLGRSTWPIRNDCENQGKNCRTLLEINSENRTFLFDPDDENYERYLMDLDPNDTKNQDHYRVLGLSRLRFEATMAEISLDRAKVLKYHPDKRKHRGESCFIGEDYFTCITKAYEQLGVSESKRHAYDSVDQYFDDFIPCEKSINKENFFDELVPVFDRNSRWSTKQPVPELGNIDSERIAVENFYNFWFDFSSWREFSYLDEEDKGKGEDRYERRELEKKNKAERERRRKEEAKRIRKLVELAYSKDPRIEIERWEKEVARKAVASQRRRFKKLAESAGYWSDNTSEKLAEMERVERLCFSLPISKMTALCDSIEKLTLREEILTMISRAEADVTNHVEKIESVACDKAKLNKNVVTWTNEEIQLLVKASNMYPPGTVDRWVMIADYINDHRKDKCTPIKNEKQCKAMQSVHVKVPVTTQDYVSAALTEKSTWTLTEQKLLEQAIKTYPASDPERWDKVMPILIKLSGKNMICDQLV
ncbi:DnaJ domain protein [Dictyocaulus viviparus]|uniref:DnaJ domain protein n=1 Tax=Dictyocaulus viviparus TaxID=29172 RepID=A0A0D8Y688_DICVI|nr:DnaJ domain protein [Dictyocaulus viviparus]